MIKSIGGGLSERLEARTAKVAVLGLGYVGMPLAVHLGQAGFQVTGFDPQQQKVARINAGHSPVQDVHASDISLLVDAQRLQASTNPNALAGHDVFILCVPTPLDNSKQPDISYIVAAARLLLPHLRPDTLVILESTTYPGTTKDLLVPLLEESGLIAGQNLFVAFSPERVDPGNQQFHTGNIPKLVGGICPEATKLAASLYRSFLAQVHTVRSASVAEMAKLHENTFRAVNIGYVNELAMICQTLGIDVWEVVDAASTKPFGFMPFYPGPGIGGHCIPLDPHYLAWRARKEGFDTRFIDLADQVNSQMPRYVVNRVMEMLNERERSLRGANILVFGVTYKANVDDARESPALDVIGELERRGANVRFIDPFVRVLPDAHGRALRAQAAEAAPETYIWADLGLILTAHDSFDWDIIVPALPQVFDTRGVTRYQTHQGALL